MNQEKGKVGVFYYIAKKVNSDSVDWDKAEDYGDFKTWGSHYSFWDSLCRKNCDFQELDYNYFPRGRVTYNRVKDLYYVYLNPKLNKKGIVDKIKAEFSLGGLDYIIDEKDEHYQS